MSQSNKEMTIMYEYCINIVPYSGKLSLVQNFVKSCHPGLQNKMFVVLNFAPVLQQNHTHHQLIGFSARYAPANMQGAMHIEIFMVLIFTEATLSAKIVKFCTMRKFPAI